MRDMKTNTHKKKRKEHAPDRQLWMLRVCLYMSVRVSSFSVWQIRDKVVKSSTSVDTLAHSVCIQAAAATVSSFYDHRYYMLFDASAFHLNTLQTRTVHYTQT